MLCPSFGSIVYGWLHERHAHHCAEYRAREYKHELGQQVALFSARPQLLGSTLL